MKILIVDDEKIIREGIEKRITRYNPQIEVLHAPNGIIAKEIIQQEKIDACFVDITMPFLNGLELIQQVNNHPIDFVIISGHENFDYAQQAIKLKVLAYLLKPIDRQEFENVLEQICQKHTFISNQNDNINKIIQHIQQHYHQENYNLKQLSDYLLLSESYICRLLKKEIGQTFIELVTKQRIERAKMLIRQDSSTVSFKTIYHQVGFSSQQYFNVIFKKLEKMTPKEYLELQEGQ